MYCFIIKMHVKQKLEELDTVKMHVIVLRVSVETSDYLWNLQIFK